MISALKSRLKERKIIPRIFSFLSAVLITLCLSTVTAFAEGGEGTEESTPPKNSKGYPELVKDVNPETGTLLDGETPWSWPLDGIYHSIRDALYNVNMDNLYNAFYQIDRVTDEANDNLSKTPKEYQSTIFKTVDIVAKNVIMPIATVILTYVVLLDFFQNVMDRNNFHDFDTSIFFRWALKTTVAILFVTNATTIANAFFDVGKTLADNLVIETAKVTGGGLSNNEMMMSIGGTLSQCGFGTLFCILIPVLLLSVVSIAINILIYVIMIGRMIEIYLHLSVAPIPLATITNREFGEAGKNYLKIIFSFVLQMFFLLLCICIYRALVLTLADKFAALSVSPGGNVLQQISGCLFEILAYGVVLVITMFKSGSLAKSILGAH